MQGIVEQLTEVGMAEEVLHDIQSLIDGAYLFEGKYYPALEQASAHGTDGLVDDVEQRLTPIVHRMDELKAAHGVAVEAHITLLLDARECSDMLNLCVQGHLQVMEYSTRSDNAILEMLDAEALEVLDLEVLDELLPGKRFGEGPVVELEGAVFGAENTFKLVTQSMLEEYLLRPKIDQQLVDIVEGSLGGEKLTRRNIQE